MTCYAFDLRPSSCFPSRPALGGKSPLLLGLLSFTAAPDGLWPAPAFLAGFVAVPLTWAGTQTSQGGAAENGALSAWGGESHAYSCMCVCLHTHLHMYTYLHSSMYVWHLYCFLKDQLRQIRAKKPPPSEPSAGGEAKRKPPPAPPTLTSDMGVSKQPYHGV